MIEWEWYKDSHMVHLFIHLILNANRKDGSWKGYAVKRGQFITGRKELSKDTGISQQSIRTCIKRLKSTSEITIKSTNKFSVITVCNYDVYQPVENEINQQINQQSNHQSTSNQPATNHKQEVKNNKNNKNINNILLSQLSVDDFKDENHKIYYLTAKSFHDLFYSNIRELEINNSTLNKAKGTWVNDIRLMFEIDKRTKAEFKEVWNFLKNDDWWKNKVLCTSKLRKQFEQLLIKSRSQKRNGKNIQHNQKGATPEQIAKAVYKHFGDQEM